MPDAHISIRLPAATKARWVRESRAAGMRLTDWIIQRVEGPQKEEIMYITIGSGNAGEFMAWSARACDKGQAEHAIAAPAGAQLGTDMDGNVTLTKGGVHYIQNMRRTPRKALIFVAHCYDGGAPVEPGSEPELRVPLQSVS